MTSHRFFGEAGLSAMRRAYSAREDAAILATLRRRLDAGAMARLVEPEQLGEMRLLVSSPGEFIPCGARSK